MRAGGARLLRRWGLTGAGLLATLLPLAGEAAASTPSAALLNAARLVGRFTMSGTVTDAAGVRREQRGQRVVRTWSFAGACPNTPCQTAGLIRSRAAGTDQLTLSRRSPSIYAGRGSFTLPLSCGGRHYPRGELVPFTITVVVQAVRVTGYGPLVSQVRASYRSPSRRNLTPCLLVPAHDAAHYTGTFD